MPKYPQNCVTQNLIVFNLIVYIFVRYCQKHTQPDEARPAVHKTLPGLAREYISPTYTAKNSKGNILLTICILKLKLQVKL